MFCLGVCKPEKKNKRVDAKRFFLLGVLKQHPTATTALITRCSSKIFHKFQLFNSYLTIIFTPPRTSNPMPILPHAWPFGPIWWERSNLSKGRIFQSREKCIWKPNVSVFLGGRGLGCFCWHPSNNQVWFQGYPIMRPRKWYVSHTMNPYLYGFMALGLGNSMGPN